MADINTLISAIPLAVDGQPITSNYHNTLRAALEVIAQNLGVTGPPQSTLTFAAPFQRNGATSAWVFDNSGTAIMPTASMPATVPPSVPGNADGWFLVQLPNGGNIQSVTFFGKKNGLANPAGLITAWTGQLFRLPLTPSGAGLGPAMFSADLDAASVDGSNNFREQAVPNVTSRFVDNDNFKYIVTSKVLNGNPNGEARISSVQIVVARSTTVTPPSTQTSLLFPFITN